MNKYVMAFLTALITSTVFAGQVNDVPVVVTIEADGSGSANGNMVTARFSDNDVEFIGCGVRNFDDGVNAFEFGFCQASDSEGNAAFCNTESPVLLDAVAGMSDYSFVSFRYDAEGICTNIGFSTQSFYIPDGVQKSKKSKKSKKSEK